MPIKEKLEAVRGQLDAQITGFDRRRHETRKIAYRIRFAVVTCSALTTIVIGLERIPESIQPLLKNGALVFSVLVTAISALEAFYNHRALWIRYTATFTELKALRSKLECLTAGGLAGLDEAKIDPLFGEFQQVLRETNDHWFQLRKETEPKTND